MKERLLKLIRTIRIVPKLGIHNVFYVFYYRLSLKLGFRKKKFKYSEIKKGDFFIKMETPHPNSSLLQLYRDIIVNRADNIIKGVFTFYHYHQFDMGEIPNWFYDPFSKKALDNEVCNKHWVDLNEFDLNTGDIKNLWEISRFDWLTDLARAYVVTNNDIYFNRLNQLLTDWVENNPVNKGVNWRCGQETSLRIMKMFWSSKIINNMNSISDSLFDFILKHLERVEANINYAIAQDNNHGTSEAAALYIGSAWLLKQNKVEPDIRKTLNLYRKKGRRILESRVDKLVLKDGTFAQKSVNYHRVVIDTISFVLLGMKEFDESPFDKRIDQKLYQLGLWLLQMISNDKGEVPNMGANDGAMFMSIHGNDYRDYRTSLQLYFSLLLGKKIWNNQQLDEPLIWSDVDLKSLTQFNSIKFPDTYVHDREFVQLVMGDILLRVLATQNNFRPSQDVMHVDLFYKGENILLDTGSYSYNADESQYFRSIEAHNSLQFGDKQPMPRLSRFLNGEWVKVKSSGVKVKNNRLIWSGHYKDYRNNYHKRTITLYSDEKRIEILDNFKSKKEFESKTIRFNLCEDYQKFISLSCYDKNGNKIESKQTKGWQSLYYMNKSKIEVMEFSLNIQNGFLKTIIDFN